MKIVGISGWSGSGKTTLVVKLIPALVARGHSVSTLKHAHHRFDVDRPGKDSFRHRDAGAREVLISSKARWALMHENRDEEEVGLDELIRHMTPVDILLIEGFKKDSFPKIEVWRGTSDNEPLYKSDSTVIAIASDLEHIDTSLRVLDLNDSDAIADFIIATFLQKAQQ